MTLDYNASVEARILGGLPVLIRFKAVAPDTRAGETGPYVEDWEVVSRTGRAFGQWIYDRIKATPGETERIKDACYDHLAEVRHDINDD